MFPFLVESNPFRLSHRVRRLFETCYARTNISNSQKFKSKNAENSWIDCNGLRVMTRCYHLRHFHHANGLHFCHRFLLHICRAGAANVLTLACADFQGWERVRCRLNFTVKIYQDPKFVFLLVCIIYICAFAFSGAGVFGPIKSV